MKYENEEWPIEKLVGLIEKRQIDLSPQYQRNDIWSTQAQEKLVATIKRGWPLPTFFVLGREPDYEMVDGQQRSRAILGYVRGSISDEAGNKFNGEKEFLNYAINVTIITEIDSTEKIEDFYTLVNSSGLHINRPELFKAKYYDTRFLWLVRRLARHETFRKIKLFSQSAVNRMNDIDLVSELVTGLEYGITDKKLKVDELFEQDVSVDKAASLERMFNETLSIFDMLDNDYPLRSTRYKQRNDFYSLFLLFSNPVSEDISIPKYFYRVLRAIGPYISPSQEDCETLKEYAIHCVTQSNGKMARQKRQDILAGLLMNENGKANGYQEDVLAFFELPSSATYKIGDYLTLDCEQIERFEPDA